MLVVSFCLLRLLSHVVHTYVKYVLYYKYLQFKILQMNFFHSSANYILVRNPERREIPNWTVLFLCHDTHIGCTFAMTNLFISIFWEKPYSNHTRCTLRCHFVAKTSSFLPAGARSHNKENLIAVVIRVACVLSGHTNSRLVNKFWQ